MHKKTRKLNSQSMGFKIGAYAICGILTVLSLLPFIIMVVNATRSTSQIQQHALSLIPSTYLLNNLKFLAGKTFNPITGFVNSAIIATGSTVCTLYFSAMTAYALVAYQWKLRNAFFTTILCVMMIPSQITAIGFYQFMFQIGLTNNFLALILPAIASPVTVFFMRQYMVASLPLELLDAARIDGSKELYTFNHIVMPIVKPAVATQGIFTFVGSWNTLFMPSVLLTDTNKFTMPIMVAQLKSATQYQTEFGAIYLALTLTVLPLFIVYFALSKYIIAGVALGGVKG